MWRCVLLIGLGGLPIGCHNLPRKHAHVDACPAPVTTVTAPAPKIEIESPETIVVKAPTPKYVFEDSGECTSSTCAAAATGRHFKHACGRPVCNPPATPMYYPQSPGYGAAPPAYGAPSPAYGAGMIGGEIKDRTAIGLTMETIRIPFPWLRLKAIPQPAEVTFRSQLTNQSYGSPVMMPMAGYGAPPVAYGAPPPVAYGAPPPVVYGTPPPVAYGAPPAYPQYGAPPPMPPAYGAPPGGQVVVTGHQAVPVTGLMPVTVPAGSGQQGYGTPPGYGAPYCPPPDTPAESVEKLKQKMKECDDLKKKIDELTPPKKS